MTQDELIAYCLAKPGAWEDEPWEGDTVAKVGPPARARSSPSWVASPSVSRPGPTATRPTSGSLAIRDDASVMAYIGRSGWNTLRIGGAIPDDEIEEAIDTSYDLVVAKLPKSQRPT